MFFPPRDIVNKVKEQYPAGSRVELISMNDPYRDIDDLNYRSEPSMDGKVNGQTGKGVFTIVEVKDGWGRLKSGAGWIWLGNPTYCTVQGTVEETPKTSSTKSVGEIAKEVISGKWGNGAERREKLTDAGYDYSVIQKKVNEMLK